MNIDSFHTSDRNQQTFQSSHRRYLHQLLSADPPFLTRLNRSMNHSRKSTNETMDRTVDIWNTTTAYVRISVNLPLIALPFGENFFLLRNYNSIKSRFDGSVADFLWLNLSIGLGYSHRLWLDWDHIETRSAMNLLT